MSGSIKHTTIAEELKNGNRVTYFTVGVSMRPLLLERKTHVVIEPIGTVKTGDILLYRRKMALMCFIGAFAETNGITECAGTTPMGLNTLKKSRRSVW